MARLHRAAHRGEEAKVKQYLKARDDVNARDTDGNTALLLAIDGDYINCVRTLLAAGADPSIRDNRQCLPLYLAAQHGSIAIAKALIGANADIDALIDLPNCGTALHVAAFKGNKSMVKLLVDEGCDTSKRSADGRHPLTTASIEGHFEVVTVLLDAGADTNVIGPEGITPLLAATQEGSCDLVKVLLERGANVNHSRPDGTTALYLAVSEGFDEVVNVLMAAGADVDHARADKITPLHTACYCGKPKCVWALLRAGANVSARDIHGSAPLHKAAFKGFTDVIEVLLSGGAQADVNLEDHLRRTPLTSASAFADAKAVNLLLDAGAEINRPTGDGETALMKASDLGIVKVLLDRGADATLLNNYGSTVLHCAGAKGACAFVRVQIPRWLVFG